MNSILSILQILGIVLLIVLGIVILLVSILLFYPLFYKAEGELQETKWAKGSFSWLFHLVHGRMTYEDELFYGELFIFGRRVQLAKEMPGTDETSVGSDEKGETEPSTEQAETVAQETAASETATLNLKTEHVATDDVSPDSDVTDEKITGDQKLIERLKKIYRKLCNKIRLIRDAYPRIKKIITDKQNHQAVIHLKDELIYLIKILLPKKSSVRGSFSTGSPDTTGQIFGFMAMFPLIYTEGWSIVPDFQAEKAYFEGTFRIKGRFYLYQLVGIVLRIVLDKDCRRMYSMIQSFKNFMKKRNVQEDK